MTEDGQALTQSFYLGKMDFWTQQNVGKPGRMSYFSHVAPGPFLPRSRLILLSA